MAQPNLEPELLKDAPLRYAPVNEMGVVFLFSHLCRRMQLHVESVQAGFPDCIARQRIGGKERRLRIEFEFRSSNYRAHGHPLNGCDWIVCWEHDWPDVPPGIKVVELRRHYGRGFNVWMVSLPPQHAWPARGTYGFGKRVMKGDLVLVYEWSPKQSFQQVYTVTDNVDAAGADGLYLHTIRRVCALPQPIHRKVLEADRLIGMDAVNRQKFNRKMTEDWWRIYEVIIARNPATATALARFSPSRV
jgi:hypothetical protein